MGWGSHQNPANRAKNARILALGRSTDTSHARDIEVSRIITFRYTVLNRLRINLIHLLDLFLWSQNRSQTRNISGRFPTTGGGHRKDMQNVGKATGCVDNFFHYLRIYCHSESCRAFP